MCVQLTIRHMPPPLQVYDVTSYLDDHPGGAESILLNTGVDASEEFNSIHSQVGGTGAWLNVPPTHEHHIVHRWAFNSSLRCTGAWSGVPPPHGAVAAPSIRRYIHMQDKSLSFKCPSFPDILHHSL
jgi:hypothetical protein